MRFLSSSPIATAKKRISARRKDGMTALLEYRNMPQYTLSGSESTKASETVADDASKSDEYTIAFRLQRCSDSTCACESGKPRDLHGPYEVHIHRIDGVLRPEYIGKVRDEFKRTNVEVIERDENICQRCGDRAHSGFHPVHHIERPETFDDPQEAHTEDNCVQLCSSCHMKTESLSVETQRAMFERPSPTQRTLSVF